MGDESDGELVLHLVNNDAHLAVVSGQPRCGSIGGELDFVFVFYF